MENETQRLARKLTDDRNNPDLLVFEKTWGHRLLAGVSVGMLVAAFVIIAYCAYRVFGLASLGVENYTATFGFVLYSVGLACGVAVIPPALLGLYVAKHPKWANMAIVAPFVAFALLGALAVYAMSYPTTQLFSVALYVGVGCVFPLVYLIAAIKVKRSA